MRGVVLAGVLNLPITADLSISEDLIGFLRFHMKSIPFIELSEPLFFGCAVKLLLQCPYSRISLAVGGKFFKRV
jgi:hypothetical protein